MNQGHSAAWDQLWDRAARYYRQALEEFPEHPQALSNLGLALYELQDYEAALRVYQRAARHSPNDPILVEKVAQLFERQGNLEQASAAALHAAELYLKNRDINKAIENWIRVTRLKPENLSAHGRLAMVYERLGEKEKSVAEYLALASFLQSGGNSEKALQAIQQALQLVPNHPQALQALGLMRAFRPLPRPNRPHGSTGPLRMAQVRQLAPPAATHDEPQADPVIEARQRALTALAGLLFEGAEEAASPPAAHRGFQLVLRGSGSERKGRDPGRIMLHLSQVVDLQTHGECAQAAAELEKAVEAGLDHPAASFDLGYLRSQEGGGEGALRLLQAAARQDDFALGARLLMAGLYEQAGRLKEAALEYLEALRLADSQAVSREEADGLHQLYESLIEAFRQQESAENQRGLCASVHDLLLRSDWRQQLARARSEMPASGPGSPPAPLAEILVQAGSSQVIGALAQVHALAQRGSLRSAMEEAFYALQHAPTYLPLHCEMGELLLKQERLPDAIEKFLMVARSYTIRGEPQRAIDLYRRILSLAPLDLNARSRLIEQLLGRGQVENALLEYQHLAEVYYKLADLEMARKTLTEALRVAQSGPIDRQVRVQILHTLADINTQSLEWRQALRVFEQIRTLQPTDTKARARLVELNLRLGQEDQALTELDSYIAYLFGHNQRPQAIAFVEGLVSESPDYPCLQRRLSDLYRQAGKASPAIG